MFEGIAYQCLDYIHTLFEGITHQCSDYIHTLFEGITYQCSDTFMIDEYNPRIFG